MLYRNILLVKAKNSYLAQLSRTCSKRILLKQFYFRVRRSYLQPRRVQTSGFPKIYSYSGSLLCHDDKILYAFAYLSFRKFIVQ